MHDNETSFLWSWWCVTSNMSEIIPSTCWIKQPWTQILLSGCLLSKGIYIQDKKLGLNISSNPYWLTNIWLSPNMHVAFTHPPACCKLRCQHFLLPSTGTRWGQRWESSSAARLSWCPGSVGWNGRKRSARIALLLQQNQALHSGDGTENRVKAEQFQRGEDKNKASPPRLQRDVADCRSKTDAVEKFSLLHRTDDTRSLGENTCVCLVSLRGGHGRNRRQRLNGRMME